MTKQRKSNRRMRNASVQGDTTLREFQTQDLGDDVKESAAMMVRQQPTSILLPSDLKARLRKRGQELGVGYQTLAKMILSRYVDADL